MTRRRHSPHPHSTGAPHAEISLCAPNSLALDIPALAPLTHLGIRTLRRMDAAREIPGRFQRGRRVLFEADVIRAWVTAGMPALDQWAKLVNQPGSKRR